MSKLDELDEFRSKYFNKFGTIFTTWDMSPDEAIAIIRKCLEEGKQFEYDSVPDDVET
nr:MAG TPA: OHCU decarboxylase [Caudoviricetes sp.]